MTTRLRTVLLLFDIASSIIHLFITLITCSYPSINHLILEHRGCGMDTGNCFQTCVKPTAYIATEKFPAGISETEACTWRIEGIFGQYVSLDILHLDISLNGSCSGTFLSVYDISLSNELSLISSMCKYNRTYNTIISGWHKIQVEFRTFGGTGNGFLGLYHIQEFTQESFPTQYNKGMYISSNYIPRQKRKYTWYEVFIDTALILIMKIQNKSIRSKWKLTILSS